MNYLSAEHILELHARLVDAIGGAHGVREPGLLASLAEKPRAAFDGRELYSSVYHKVAIYLESIVNYHVFVDGNKRTGFAVCVRFLETNGYLFTASNKDSEMFVLGVATKIHDIEAITAWLEKNSKPIR